MKYRAIVEEYSAISWKQQQEEDSSGNNCTIQQAEWEKMVKVFLITRIRGKNKLINEFMY